MKRHEERAPAELRAALESWDPVRGEGEPAADEVAAVRRRVLAVAPPARAPWTLRWRPVVLAAAAVVLVVVLVRERGDGRSAIARTGAGTATAARVEADGASVERLPIADRGRGAAAPPSGGATDPSAAGPARGTALSPERLADAGPRPIAGGPALASPGDDAPSLVAGAGAAGEETGTGPATPAAPDRLAATPGSAAAEAAPPLAGAPGAIAPHREIHIVAPGGTRIVWLVAAGPDPTTDSPEENT